MISVSDMIRSQSYNLVPSGELDAFLAISNDNLALGSDKVWADIVTVQGTNREEASTSAGL